MRRSNCAPSNTSLTSCSVLKKFVSIWGLSSGLADAMDTRPRLVGRQVLKETKNAANGSGLGIRPGFMVLAV